MVAASPLLSLEQQVQEALRRAEDLQRQMSAMQACGLAQLGSPQQHAADAFPDGCQPASDRDRRTEDVRRAAQPCPETASVSQSSPGCAVIPESQHGSHGGAEAAEPQLATGSGTLLTEWRYAASWRQCLWQML